MNELHGELIGWIVSVSVITAVLAVLLFQIRRNPTPAESIPWREVAAVTIAFLLLLIVAFLLPFAGRVFFTSPHLPSLLT